MGDEEWRLLPHSKLHGIAPSIPSGLHFPEVVNEHEATHKAVAFAPDDSCIARIVRLNRVVVNEFAGGAFGPDKVINTGAANLSCLSFGPFPQNMFILGSNGRGRSRFVLATGHTNGSIRLWDSHSTQLITQLCSHKNKVQDIIFSQRTVGGNPVVISISCDTELKVWDGEYSGWNMSYTLKLASASGLGVPLCASFHPSSNFFAVSGTSRTVVYNISPRPDSTGEGWIDRHSNSCQLSQQPKASSKSSQELRVTIRHKLDGHSAIIVRCKYTPDGSLLITASWDTRINIWDAYTGVQVATLLDNGGKPDPSPTSLFVVSTSYSRDVSCDFSCSAIASVSSDGSLAVWNPWSTEASFERECSPSSGSKEYSYKVVTKPEIISNLGSNTNYTTLTFSNKNNYVVVADDEGSAQIFTLAKPVPSLAHQCRNKIRAVALDRWPKSNSQQTDDHTLQIKNLLPRTLQSYLSYETIPRTTNYFTTFVKST